MRPWSSPLGDQERRLVQCFALVFPRLPEQEIPQASVTNLEEWDSLASVNLFAVVEERFDIEIQSERLEDLISFQQVLTYLRDVGSPS